MKTILLIFLVAVSTQCFAQVADEGSYVVVRGAVSGCERWTSRILDAVKIEGEEPISLLGIPEIDAWSLEKKQIKTNLLSAIEKLRGSEPESISVEILESEAKYNTIAREFLFSLNLLLDGSCPFKGFESMKRGNEDLEEGIEKIKRSELARSVV